VEEQIVSKCNGRRGELTKGEMYWLRMDEERTMCGRRG
jgi:hypothetical protein